MMNNLVEFENVHGKRLSIAANNKITSVQEFAASRQYDWPIHTVIIQDGIQFTVKGTYAEVRAKLDAARAADRVRDAGPDLLAEMELCANGLERDARMYPDGNFPDASRFLNRATSLRAAIAKAT